MITGKIEQGRIHASTINHSDSDSDPVQEPPPSSLPPGVTRFPTAMMDAGPAFALDPDLAS